MQYEKFIYYLQNVDKMGENEQALIAQLVEAHPYFNLGRWLHLKVLQNTESVYFDKISEKTTIYTNDRRNLYYFIFPEAKVEDEAVFMREEGSGSYFDLIGSTEQEDQDEGSKNTLSELAKKLLSARASVQEKLKPEQEKEIVKQVEAVQVDENIIEPAWGELESHAKQMIYEKRYKEALVILEELNLNNPKKSVYFADQIRFLKKIVES